MERGLALLCAAAVWASAAGCQSWSSRGRGVGVERKESAWSVEALERAAAYAREIGSAAVLVLEDGEVVFSFGDLEARYKCHSIRKPFLGALYGIYVERGVIDLGTTLEELGIDDTPHSLTRAEKRATVRDLLMSRSGVYHEAAGEHPAMVRARPPRGSHPPGSFFYYNNWDFNALGTIFEAFTGKRVFGAFYEDIAKPIGMEDFSFADCSYSYERSKSRHPAYFFRMSTRDMARFGLLYQNWGAWDGRQIVPEAWIRQSTTAGAPGVPAGETGSSGGGAGGGRASAVRAAGDPYGFLWRIIPEEAGAGRGYYHAGLGVHLLAVLPDQGLVLVHRVDTDRDFDVRWLEVRRLMEMIAGARE